MNLTTLSQKLRIARNEADEDATLLDLTTLGDYENRPSVLGDTGVGVIDLLAEEVVSATEMDVNGIEFMFSGGSTAGKTFGFRILAWRNSNGPARLAAVGTGELGTQAVVKYPHNGSEATDRFWADNLVITYENWPKEVEATDTGNSNSVASIWLDAAGYRYWKIEITDADGSTGTEAGDIAAYWGLW
jgi:hypothetical protein